MWMPLQSENYHRDNNVRALLFDLGDTLMWETSEVKDENGTTISADLPLGAADLIRRLRDEGYWLAIVADSMPRTPVNVLEQHGLLELFDAIIISRLVGVAKPDPKIFLAALYAIGVGRSEYPRVYMIGNNLEKDIVGANGVGIGSIFIHPSDRRRGIPERNEETPTYRVQSIAELSELIDRLDSGGGITE